MGKIAETGSVANVGPDEVGRFASIAIKNIISQMNGNLTVGENISAKVFPVSFGEANVQLIFAHGLGREPLIWVAGDLTSNAVIFQFRPADANNVYLGASAVCSAKIFVI